MSPTVWFLPVSECWPSAFYLGTSSSTAVALCVITI